MCSGIESILKHKTQFTKINNDHGEHTLYIERKTITYQSDIIQNGNLMNINSVKDLYRMVRPFTEYLTSKQKQKRGDDYLVITYDIQVITYNEKYAEGHQNFTLLCTKHEQKQNDRDVCCSKTIIEYEVGKMYDDVYNNEIYENDNDDMVYNDNDDDDNDDVVYGENNNDKAYEIYFKNPFRIQIVKHKKYKQKKRNEKRNEKRDEKRGDSEGRYFRLETPINLSGCVACLNNYPNILLLPCLHWCLCVDCEEKATFETCPYCRCEIYRTVYFDFLN